MTPEEVRECMSEYDVDNGKLKTFRVPSVARGAGADVTAQCGLLCRRRCTVLPVCVCRTGARCSVAVF
jgi:hypothetical protein